MPDLRARPLAPEVLSALLDRRPYLLRALAEQVLPPPRAIEPAAQLGIAPASLQTAEEVWRAANRVFQAASRGEIALADGARIARGLAARLRALRRLERRMEKPARAKSPKRPRIAAVADLASRI